MEVRRIRLRILKGNTFPYEKQIFFMTITAESPASLGHSRSKYIGQQDQQQKNRRLVV